MLTTAITEADMDTKLLTTKRRRRKSQRKRSPRKRSQRLRRRMLSLKKMTRRARAQRTLIPRIQRKTPLILPMMRVVMTKLPNPTMAR
jgi:hypothetical protein